MSVFRPKHIAETWSIVTSGLFIKQMIWVGILWAIMTFTLLVNIDFLNGHYGDAPRMNDILLDNIEETESHVELSELTGVLGTIGMIFIMWQEGFRRAPKLLMLMALMYMLRGFTIPLTPLGQIKHPALTYPETDFVAQNFYFGMFFSGHTASAWIQIFFIKRGHPLRPVAYIAGFIQMYTLIVSHQHYTVDLFGGLIVAYFFTHFDLMRLVPRPLLNVKWMPWYTGEPIIEREHESFNTCNPDYGESQA